MLDRMFSEVRESIVILGGISFNLYRHFNSMALSEVLLLILSIIFIFILSINSKNFNNLYYYRTEDTGLMYSLLFPMVVMEMNGYSSPSNYMTNLLMSGLILSSLLPVIIELLKFKLTPEFPPKLFPPNFFPYFSSLSFILIFAYWLVLLLNKADLSSFLFIMLLFSFHLFFLINTPGWLPGSLTLGELNLISQGFVYFIFISLSTFLSIRIQERRGFISDVILFKSKIILSTIFLILFLFILLISFVSWLRNHWIKFYSLLFFLFIVFGLPIYNLWIRGNWVIWLFKFFFQSRNSLFLLLLWSCCVIGALLVIRHFSSSTGHHDNQHSTEVAMGPKLTVVRKLFHLLVIVVFISGFFLNEKLLAFSSAFLLACFILFECMRVLEIPPLGEKMVSHLSYFIDDQDSGLLLLTPIFLLIGSSAPLWLQISHAPSSSSLLSLAGVISIGVGDSVASVMGSKYGRIRWKKSLKTVEGTIFSIISQLFCCFFLVVFDNNNTISMPTILTSVVLSSLSEAFTTQIDNLTLPLFFYFLLF